MKFQETDIDLDELALRLLDGLANWAANEWRYASDRYDHGHVECAEDLDKLDRAANDWIVARGQG